MPLTDDERAIALEAAKAEIYRRDQDDSNRRAALQEAAAKAKASSLSYPMLMIKLGGAEYRDEVESILADADAAVGVPPSEPEEPTFP
jgi:hypothetical protein